MNCVDCKDFTCSHRSESTGGGSCYYESSEEKEKLLTMAAEVSLHYVDWSSFRREAAKDILPTIINWRRLNEAGANLLISKEEAVKLAIEYADELIKQLKDGELSFIPIQ